MNTEATSRFLFRSTIFQNPYVCFNFSRSGYPKRIYCGEIKLKKIFGESPFCQILHRKQTKTRNYRNIQAYNQSSIDRNQCLRITSSKTALKKCTFTVMEIEQNTVICFIITMFSHTSNPISSPALPPPLRNKKQTIYSKSIT